MIKQKDKLIMFSCLTICLFCLMAFFGVLLFDIKPRNFSNYNREWWSAFGSVLCGVGTFFTGIIAFSISKNQSEQTDQQLKISLYEKRFKLYLLFKQYYNLKSFSINNVYSINTELLKNLNANISSLERAKSNKISIHHHRFTDVEVVNIETNIRTNKEEIQKEYLKHKELRRNILNEIELFRFCFTDNIADPIINFFKVLFDENDYKEFLDLEPRIANLYANKKSMESDYTYGSILNKDEYNKICEEIKTIEEKTDTRNKRLESAKEKITPEIINKIEELLTIY